jgi:hypothetical protein
MREQENTEIRAPFDSKISATVVPLALSLDPILAACDQKSGFTGTHETSPVCCIFKQLLTKPNYRHEILFPTYFEILWATANATSG